MEEGCALLAGSNKRKQRAGAHEGVDQAKHVTQKPCHCTTRVPHSHPHNFLEDHPVVFEPAARPLPILSVLSLNFWALIGPLLSGGRGWG